jgi:DNA-binding transcriptional MerR regulator
MAKKNEHYAEAERLYVQEHLGQADIAERLGVSERTVRYWAQEGNWAERRGNFAEATGKTHEKLFKLIQSLTDKAIQSAESGEEPSQSQLYFIAKMAPLLLKLQGYEEAATDKAAPEAEKPKGLTEETIRKIESEILGIKR